MQPMLLSADKRYNQLLLFKCRENARESRSAHKSSKIRPYFACIRICLTFKMITQNISVLFRKCEC